MQPASKESLGTNCLNCGHVPRPNEKFCPECGQPTNTQRITNRQLVRDFFKILIKADRGILRLMTGLAKNPGKTATEYIEGQRKKYFNPFGFLALCIAFMLFLGNWIRPYIDLSTPDPKKLALIANDELRYKYLLTLERLAWTERFFNKNLNLISVLITPYFAFFLWVFFKHRGRNMAEIFVAYIFFTGFANVISAVIVYPFLAMSHHSLLAYNIILNTNLFLQTLYFAWGLKRFFGYRTTGDYFRVLGSLLLIGFIGLIVVLLAYYFYVLQGDFRLLPYLGKD
jgi:hypothetical protein